MVPLKEPKVVRGTAVVSTKRSMAKPPVAPANRPVPPVMVAISTATRTPGVAAGLTYPIKSADSMSPLAATNS